MHHEHGASCGCGCGCGQEHGDAHTHAAHKTGMLTPAMEEFLHHLHHHHFLPVARFLVESSTEEDSAPWPWRRCISAPRMRDWTR